MFLGTFGFRVNLVRTARTPKRNVFGHIRASGQFGLNRAPPTHPPTHPGATHPPGPQPPTHPPGRHPPTHPPGRHPPTHPRTRAPPIHPGCTHPPTHPGATHPPGRHPATHPPGRHPSNMTQLRNQRNVTLSHVCVSMQSVQYCNSHLSHMGIFSGSNLVQQRAQTSPSSPTTSSSSLSSRVGAVHTCAGTCSHGPYGGYRTCLNSTGRLRPKRGRKCYVTPV